MATYGQLQAFNPDTDSVTAYIERVHLFFAANDIPDKKLVPVFLSTIGGKTYELLRNLVNPNPPETLKLSELTETLKRYYEPKPLVIAERFHFHRRFQAADENVAEFMAQLRRLSEHCDFGAYLDQALRDRLVCGLRNESIQRRLLAESDLSLTRALELAQGMEAAESNVKSLKGAESAVHKVTTQTSIASTSTSTPCYRCGHSNHAPNECRFREAVCHYCNKKGHIAPACRAKKQQDAARNQVNRKGPFNRKARSTHFVSTEDQTQAQATMSTGDNELPLYTISDQTSPFRTNVFINNKQISMEIDTGAAVSIMSAKQQKLLFPDAKLDKSCVKLKTYTGKSCQSWGR